MGTAPRTTGSSEPRLPLEVEPGLTPAETEAVRELVDEADPIVREALPAGHSSIAVSESVLGLTLLALWVGARRPSPC